MNPLIKKIVRMKNNKSQILWCFLAVAFLGVSFHGRFVAPVQAADAGQEEEELFLIAQKAFDDGFYDVAIRYITQFQQTFPQSGRRVQAQLLLGQCYFFKNQYLKAFDIFQGLLSATEYKDTTLFWLGETYFKGSDYNQAKSYYQQLLDAYPQSPYVPQAYYSLAWTCLEQTDYAGAEDNFQKLIQKFPDHQLAEEAFFRLGECTHNQGKYDKAIEFFKAYLARYPQSNRQAQALFYIAEANYYLDDFLTAINFYARAAESALDKKLVFTCKVSMGWSYLRLEKYDLAQKSFGEAQGLTEENKELLSDDIYLGQASLYSAMENYAKSKEFYLKLIEQFPNSPRVNEAYLGRANADYALKNYPGAIAEYQELITRTDDPTGPEDIHEKAHYGLAWTYLKNGDIDSAVKTFEAIASKTKNDAVKVSAMAQMADAYQDTNQLEKAIEIYDRILRDYPESLPADYAQFRQGVALLKLNKIEAAALSFLSLKMNFPGSKYLVDTQYYLGVAYFKKEDWLQCLQYIQNYLQSVSPQNEFAAEANYMLAVSQFNLKKFKEALAVFQRIEKDFPQDKNVLRVSQLYLAKCLSALGQDSAAVKEFEAITQIYPDTETAQEALLWLGDYSIEKSNLDEASRYYAQFLEKFPGSDKVSLVHYQIGQTYQAQGKLDLALNQYTQIPASPDREIHGKAQLAIADIFSKTDDSETALKSYRDMAQNSPEFKRDALSKIARIFENEKDYAAAIDAFQQTLATPKASSQTTDLEIRFAIADLFETVHQTDQAVENFLKIPYLYPQETAWVIKAYLRVAQLFENEEKWDEAKITYAKVIHLKTEEAKHAAERIAWIDENVFHKK